MKQVKTFLLIFILIVLLLIKFFPEKQIETEEIIVSEDDSVISVDLTKAVQKTYFLDETSDGRYNLSLVYVVLYDDVSESIISDLEYGFQNRIELFDEFVERESLGGIISGSKLRFMNVEDFGSKVLSYDRSIFDWIKDFYDQFDNTEYNSLVFVPIYEMDWCGDALSQGFNYKGKIFFCLESFFNPFNSVENRGAVGLMIHKFLHGFGFNHQDQMYKQYAFLDWQLGLPETNILLHGNFRDFDHSFFDEHTMKVLDLTNKTTFENGCLDKEGFICESTNSFFCKDSWGPFCQDIDKDGVVDSEDSHVFSSPQKGNDSDGDGIVDQLDLCDWNEIIVSGKGIKPGPLKIRALQNNVRIFFSGEEVSITKITLTPFEMIGGFIKFDEGESIEKNGEEIVISNSESSLWRIKVFYEHNKKSFFRSFYFYFPGFDADFFYEKEWYYFNRFGCDIPIRVDFSDTNTYDSNLDGLPDINIFEWAKKIGENYDWDDDDFADVIDTLPTINGDCSNEFVKGVKDSDKDGFCDPGKFDFSYNSYIEDYEISMIFDYNKFSDLCPYISGNNSGCLL